MYANISEKFPCLSRAELLSLLENKGGFKEVASLTGIVLFELENIEEAVEAQRKSSTIKSAGIVLSLFDAKGRLEYLKCVESFSKIEVKRIQGMNRKVSREDAAAIILKELMKECRTIRKIGAPEIEVFITEGLIVVGLPLSKESKGEIMGRNPHNLPFYKPGALNPWYARLLVNLASPDKKGIIYDPFCGTATIPLAASEIWNNLEILCSDIRRDMCAGAKKNLEVLSRLPFDVIRADAASLPFRQTIINYVVSDPPYDRSVKSFYSEAVDLLHKTLENLSSLVKKEGRIVISIDENIAKKLIVPEEFEYIFKCPMYVHNRLTRTILVMKKK